MTFTTTSSSKHLKRCRQRPTSCTSDVSSRCRSAVSKYAAAFILLACQSSYRCSAFAPPESAVLFRHNDEFTTESHVNPSTDNDIFSIPTSPSSSSASAPSTNSSRNIIRERMPSWLRYREGDASAGPAAAELKMSHLRTMMQTSFLSQEEARLLESAILEAAGGDYRKIVGAVDFCSILLETMEMGAPTLIAGAFHYCACVAAREMTASVPDFTPSDEAKVWDEVQSKYYPRSDDYPSEAAQISMDVAQLKMTEIHYASITESSGKSTASSRSDTMSSGNMKCLLLARTQSWKALAMRSAACLYRLRGILAYHASSSNNDSNKDEEVPLTAAEICVAREALNIYVPLASQLGMHRLKNEIEDSAFQILYPRQYEQVTSLTGKLAEMKDNINVGSVPQQTSTTPHEDMTQVLSSVTAQVSKLLEKDPVFSKKTKKATITARIKEPFSLWKKMKKLGTTNILDVPDALALRVVLEARKLTDNEPDEVTRSRDVALCYYAHKMCTTLFKPLSEDRKKDYISKPKPNGYQSLHYTACTEYKDKEWPFEIQVRSSSMHQVAEFGLAAHWDYKAKGNRNEKDSHGELKKFKLDDSSAAYLSASQEWQWKHNVNSGCKSWEKETESTQASTESIRPFLKALAATQSNLTRERVFVFLLGSKESGATLSDGKILDLPSGACVLDALRESENALGVYTNLRETTGIIHNNQSLTSVTQKLRNGDILKIPMHQGENVMKPSESYAFFP